MNWDDLRFVLALAGAGSLARAARELKVDHTTVGRRIESLEANLGVHLFTRTTAGYVLTEEGEQLLPEIRRVESAVQEIARGAQARIGEVCGTVRITAADAFGSRYLAPRLAGFVQRHPGVSVELKTSTQALDLARREADIAVRHFRSKHDHLVVQRAGEVAYALYAAEPYLERRGTPRDLADLRDHDFVSVDVSQPWPTAAWMRRFAPEARLVFVSPSIAACCGAVLGGMGIGLVPCYIGDAEPALRRLPTPEEPRQGVWLTVHRDLQRTSRVRAILDYLTGVIRADASILLGRSPERVAPS